MGYLRKLRIDGYIKMKVVVPYVELLIVKKTLMGWQIQGERRNY